jgi:hypothetical protein
MDRAVRIMLTQKPETDCDRDCKHADFEAMLEQKEHAESTASLSSLSQLEYTPVLPCGSCDETLHCLRLVRLESANAPKQRDRDESV